jgi:hypothetical protein
MQSLSVEKLLRNFTFVQKHFASLEAMFLAIMSEVLYDLDVMRSDRPSQPIREADQRIRPQLARLIDIVEQHKLTLTTELLISTGVMKAPKQQISATHDLMVPLHALQHNAPDALLGQLTAGLRQSAGNPPVRGAPVSNPFSPSVVLRPGTTGSEGSKTSITPKPVAGSGVVGRGPTVAHRDSGAQGGAGAGVHNAIGSDAPTGGSGMATRIPADPHPAGAAGHRG